MRSEGDYVVFVDGHVKWFDGKRAARFLKWDQTGYTNDIREAIPNGSWISIGWVSEGNFSGDIQNSNPKLFMYDSGRGGAE